ncbi:hypothetical protein H6G93_31720 [Nostoc sp. FACHB-973]|nr:hypothetical protein [Nostoc sp. FACHB-973]
MNKTLVLQNIGIAIAVKNHNSNLLNYDFLKYSNIVPDNWELARQPIMGTQGSQVVFRNGISLTAQQNILSFVEAVTSKEVYEIQVAEIAHNYVRALPNLEYQAVGIDLRGYITANHLNQEASVESYMRSLLAPAPWQEVGIAPVKSVIQLAFTLEAGQLNLNINEGKLYLTEEETVSIILFEGNFSYGVKGNSKEERLHSLHTLLDNWQTDTELYQNIINSKFLSSGQIINDAPQTEDVFPQLLLSQS